MRTNVRLGRIQRSGWVNHHTVFNGVRSLKLFFVCDRQLSLRCKSAKSKTRLAARKMLCATRCGLSCYRRIYKGSLCNYRESPSMP